LNVYVDIAASYLEENHTSAKGAGKKSTSCAAVNALAFPIVEAFMSMAVSIGSSAQSVD
jgi:hypothetical protein